ncbi:DUF2330 domain-containing protein [Streptomyces sp. NPDC050263]|uniref:DUF2330 domain-containing protein n=1 Tax=Streptomyces sp. NPDC050263 TaxID=3155037 RepID=UPI0034249424
MVGFPRERRRRLRARGERLRGRVVAVLLVLLAIQLGSLVAPAYACGCGALVPGDGRRLTVGREASVVRWDGKQEQLVMSLTVDGDADRAAWIMPVPNRATVELGDPELFDQLTGATAPEQRTRHHFWPQDGDWPLTTGDDDRVGPPPPGAGAGGVGVVGRQRLGPFDVARLTATDPADLDDWLRSNDFVFPAALKTALQPYVDRRWEYVAVRLTPESTGAALNGRLDPLRLTFAADTLVYPMRLSRLAATPQSLGLYILAAHRMEPASRIGGERPRVTFAGRLGTTTGPLAELAKGTPFLTAVAQEFPRPTEISGDHELRRAATDTAFRQVVYEDRLLALAGIPVWLLTVVGGLAAANTVAVVLGVRRGRARRASVPGPRHAVGCQPAAANPAPGAPTIPAPAPTTAPTAAPTPATAPAPATAAMPAAPPGFAAPPTPPALPAAPPVPSAPAPPMPSAPPAPFVPPSVPPFLRPPMARSTSRPTSRPTSRAVPPMPSTPPSQELPVPGTPATPATPDTPATPPGPRTPPRPRFAPPAPNG